MPLVILSTTLVASHVRACVTQYLVTVFTGPDGGLSRGKSNVHIVCYGDESLSPSRFIRCDWALAHRASFNPGWKASVARKKNLGGYILVSEYGRDRIWKT